MIERSPRLHQNIRPSHSDNGNCTGIILGIDSSSLERGVSLIKFILGDLLCITSFG